MYASSNVSMYSHEWWWRSISENQALAVLIIRERHTCVPTSHTATTTHSHREIRFSCTVVSEIRAEGLSRPHAGSTKMNTNWKMKELTQTESYLPPEPRT